MWLIPTRKQIKKEFSKIKKAFDKRDKGLEEIKKEIISKKEIELMIKEAILDLKSSLNLKEVQFGALSELKSGVKAKSKEKEFERTIIQRIKKIRPEAIKTQIRGLLEKGLRTTEIFKEIVINKNLCGKTQFYHYLSLVRSESPELVRTEPKRNI